MFPAGLKLALLSRAQVSRWTVYALFAGLFITFPTAVVTAPAANAAACTSTSTTIDTQTIVTFSALQSCEWTVPNGVSAVRVLVVGGGSSGGAGQGGVWWPQGGGGGAVVDQINFSTSPGTTVDVVVGAGGAAIDAQGTASTSVNNGGQSKFSTLTANGGVAPNNTLAPGGTSGNGNLGGSAGSPTSGGGGGAGGAGSSTTGGVGVNSNISGSTFMYGSGGAGSSGGTGAASPGGGTNAAAPTANRGGGGSQPTSGSGLASAGAAGVVIVRYTTPTNLNPSLSFNANGGTGSIASRSETAGVSIALPSGSGFTKRNSAFTGWNTLASGSGVGYAAGESFTITTNQILYAQWSGPVLSADLAAPQCAAGVGVGGPNAATAGPTLGGNGCVVVEYAASGVQAFKTFNYTGSDQSWTAPAGVTTVTFYLIGAGGGGSWPTGTGGGGAGFTKGSLGVAPGDVFKLIVGQAGGGVAPTVSGSCYFTPLTYGGGGRGGACAQNGYAANTRYMASGGGRSAVRLSTGTEDLLTAAGGGGGSYGGAGGAGGGLTGVNGGAPNPGIGGTQTTGGTGGASASNSLPGYAGIKYRGGDARDDSGGGGGGYYGGGGGGDNGGGGGGSSFIDSRTVTSGYTGAGAITVPGTSVGLYNLITYDGNGNTSGSAPSPTQFTVTGGSRSLATNTAGLARTGYTLTGWNTQANGLGVSYALSAAFSATQDVTLYAEWSYTITYNANGATAGTVPASVTLTGSEATSVAANPGTLALTRAVLLGWNTRADGTGTAYPGGQTGFSYDGNVTLFAMWGPATCTPTAGYTNCAVFPMSQNNVPFKLPNTVPVGTLVLAEIWGAGGGPNESSPTGGGGGGYSKVQIEVKSVGESFTIVTGQGGIRGDIVGTYGGGGRTSRNSYWGSSGGGMSGIFSGNGLDSPLVISGGGGGASPGHAVGIAGGGGAAGNPGNQRGTVSDYAIAGAPGTLSAGGAAATNTSPCNDFNATAGSRYQGGQGAGGNTANGTETGGGGGGGYFGGGGGRCQVSSGPVQNGGGGGGSGYFDSSRVSLLEVVNGENGVARQAYSGGGTSPQYVAGIGLGGGIGNSGAAGNGLVVIQWSSATFTVTFNGNSGTTTAAAVTQTVPGAKVTIADSATATRTGFTFTGWNTLADGSGTNVAVGPGYLPPSNITLFAKWSANSYPVIFDKNTPSGVAATGTMANMTIVAGTAKALSAKNFLRTGYVFRNWNSLADGTGTTYADLANVTFFETTTVYAQWNPILTYNINGGDGGTVPVAVNVVPGTNVAAPTSTITRTGFTFAGWNSAANRTGTSYLVGDSITVTVPTTVYAMWRLTVTYNGNTPTSGNAPLATTVGEFSSVTLPGNTSNLVKIGLIFVGWNTVVGGTGTRYLPGETFTPTANITLYADWLTACSPTTTYGNNDKLNTFGTAGTCAFIIPTGVTSIDFLTVGGGGGGGSNVGQGGAGGGLVYQTNVSVTAGQILIVTTGAAGTTAAAGGASSITIGRTVYNAAGGAGGGTFSPNRLCATSRTVGGTGAYANGASGGNGSSASGTAACNGDMGTAISITGSSVVYGSGGGGGGYSATAGTGGTNAGNGGNNIAGGAGVVNRGGGGGGGGAGNAAGGAGGSGVNIIAFDYISTINYDSNTATSGSITTTTWTQSYVGESLTVQSKGTLAKLGYSFTGWNTAANAGGTYYQPGDVIAPQGNATYYAIWVADTFTVTFDANNGTGTIASLTYTAGVAKALTSNTTQITRTGFTFGGWTTNANGTGTSYTNAQSIILYQGVTLYAKWNANTYAVTFGSNTANGSTLPTGDMPNQSFSAGTPFNLSTNVWYKTGFDFIGWSTSLGTQPVVYAQNQSVTLFGNTTIYTQWAAKVFTLTYSNNGGTGVASVASQNFTYPNTTTTSFATVGTMTRTGYIFGGWSATPTGTTPLTTLTLTANQTVYAIWTARSFNIAFNGNTSTSGSMSNLAMVSGTAKALTANAFSKTGFKFSNWNTVANGTGISYNDTQTVTLFSDTTTVTLFAQWSIRLPATPTLTAIAGNETATITITSSAGATSTAGAVTSYTVTALDASGNPVPGPLTCTVTPAATSCVIEGLTNATPYKFSVVANNASGNSAAGTTATTVTPQPFRVDYSVVNGGSVTPTFANYDLGTPVVFPLPTRTGYNFAGWATAATGGNVIGLNGASYSPTGNVTVYATWTGIAYPITYNSNGGTSTVPSSGSYTTGGSAYQILDAPVGMTKSGYTFTGWNTLSTGAGTNYAAGASYETPTALTLFAKWSAVNYTVTYLNSGSGTGVLPTQGAQNVGQTFSVAAGTSLSNDGYSFTGWSEASNTYYAGESYTVATSNVVLTAIWTPLQYLVLYNANGGTGTLPTEPKRSSGQSVTLASGSGLTRTGYSFAGWSESSTVYAAGSSFTMRAANVTFVAQWNPAIYTITYIPGDGSGSASRTSDSFSHGSNGISLPSVGTMSRAGYIFNGWAETSTVITGLYTTTKSETLTAQWAPGTYTITYNTNGATGSPTGAPTTYTTLGTGLTLPGSTGMTNNGYTLSGWSTTPNGSVISGAFAPTTDTTLYAIWTPAQVAIGFNAGTVAGGTPSDAALSVTSTTAAFRSNYTLPNIDSPTVTILGQVYAFTGWNSAAGVTYAAGSSYPVEASGTTFTAQWIRQFVVTYILNGGTAAAGDLETDAQCVNAGNMCSENQVITTNLAPSRSGYNFTGWVDQSSTSVAANASYTVSVGHFVLSAQWTPVTVVVSYAAAGGAATPDPQNGTYTGTVNTTSAITRTGYTFAGWSDGTLTYGAGATYRIETVTAVTLTAQWIAKNYTTSYDLNLGTSATTLSTTSHTYASSPAITSVIPTRQGYNFTNWLFNATSYESTTAFSMPDANVTFVAQWSAATYQVNYDLAGGNSTPPAQSQAAFSSTFTLPPAPTNPDATKNFLGWSDGTNTIAAGSTYAMNSSNVTFTAQWSNALVGVSYSIEGATSGVAPATQLVAPSTAVEVAPIVGISRSRFILDAWSSGVETFEPSEIITPVSNVSLAAVWVPEIPDAPVETLTATSGAVTIEVGQGSGTGGVPTSYTVTASPSGAQCTVISPATSCTISGLTNGTPYTFSVTATNSSGTSAESTAGPVTPATVPNAPTSPVATIDNGKATVSFTAPTANGGSPITSYTVTAYAPDGVTVAGTCPVIAPAVSCEISGLTNGTAYTYKVVANNALGSSAASTASAPVTPATVPGAPASISASASTATTASVTVGAATVTGGAPITSYDIIATPAGGGTPIIVNVTAAQIASAVTISGLAAGTQYTISTVAKNAVGSGVATTAGSTITTPAAPPSAPTITSATATSTTAATVVVTAPTSTGGAAITGYSATLTPLGGGSAIVETSTTTSIAPTTLSPGTTYSVTTTAVNSSGEGAASTTSTFTTPLAVTASTVSETGTVGSAFSAISVSIAATSPTNTTYSITGALPAGLSLDAATGVISGTPTISSAATVYTITASTTVAGGATSTGTATVTIRVIANVPGAPASVTASPTSTTSANVSVGASTTNGGAAITSYNVTVSPVSSGSVGTATPTAAAISAPVAVTGLTPGTEYTVSVVANNSAGSGPSTTTTSIIATPVAVQVSTASISATVGTAISPVTTSITATGETNTSFSIQGSLPAGLTLNTTTGTISGTPTSVISSTQFTITATTTLPSGRVESGTAVITLGVAPTTPTAPVAAAVTSGSTTTATVNVTAPTSNGGDSIDTYTVTVAPVNIGLSVTATSPTTTVSVTGLQPGTQYVASVTATNAAGASPSVTSSTFVTKPALSTSVSSVTGAVNTSLTPITTTLLAEAGSSATYAISGTLPAGLEFDTATGTISGTPTTVTSARNYTITATALVAGVTETATAVVALGVTYSTPTAPLAAVGTVSAGATTTAAVAITAPASNGGESIDSYTVVVTPVITGSPTTFTSATTTASLTGLAPGTEYTAAVSATNAAGSGPTITSSTFMTNPSLGLSKNSSTEAVGVAMVPVTPNLGVQPGSSATYAISGTLPAGLIFDDVTGTISGTPTSISSSANFTVTATVLIGTETKTATAVIALGVALNVQATLTLSGSSATVGTIVALTASGGSGTGSLTYAITGGTAAGCAVDSQGDLTSTGAGTCIATATKAGDTSYASATSAAVTITFSSVSTPAPTPTPAPAPAPAPAPSASPTPAPTASAAPTPAPTASAAPTPAPVASPTPAAPVKPSPAPSAPAVTPTAKPTPPPSARPTPAPVPTVRPTPASVPTVRPTPAPTKKPLDITPPKTGTDKSKTAVTVQNLIPGQKIKVTIVEGNSLPSAQATPKTTTKANPKATAKASPKPSAGGFKTTSKAPVKVVPKPSGSSAGVGIDNLKPGQKIKVTIKTGGTTK